MTLLHCWDVEVALFQEIVKDLHVAGGLPWPNTWKLESTHFRLSTLLVKTWYYLSVHKPQTKLIVLPGHQAQQCAAETTAVAISAAQAANWHRQWWWLPPLRLASCTPQCEPAARTAEAARAAEAASVGFLRPEAAAAQVPGRDRPNLARARLGPGSLRAAWSCYAIRGLIKRGRCAIKT